MAKTRGAGSRVLVPMVPPDKSTTHVVHDGETFEVGAEEGGVVRVPLEAVPLLQQIGFQPARPVE